MWTSSKERHFSSAHFLSFISPFLRASCVCPVAILPFLSLVERRRIEMTAGAVRERTKIERERAIERDETTQCRWDSETRQPNVDGTRRGEGEAYYERNRDRQRKEKKRERERERERKRK